MVNGFQWSKSEFSLKEKVKTKHTSKNKSMQVCKLEKMNAEQ